MNKGKPENELKKGSNSIANGVYNIRDGIVYLFGYFRDWLQNHPILKWVVLTPLSAGFGSLVIRLLNSTYVYFFGENVAISRDVEVEVFPAPIGFTLWLLLTITILITVTSYIKFVSLRQRIDELEKQIQE